MFLFISYMGFNHYAISFDFIYCLYLNDNIILYFFLTLCFLLIALPTAPTDVIISEVAATSVRLEWSYKGSEDLQYYVIQYKPKNANQVKMKIKLKPLLFIAPLNSTWGSVFGPHTLVCPGRTRTRAQTHTHTNIHSINV